MFQKKTYHDKKQKINEEYDNNILINKEKLGKINDKINLI